MHVSLKRQRLTQVDVCTGDRDSMEEMGVAFFCCTTLFWTNETHTVKEINGHDASKTVPGPKV